MTSYSAVRPQVLSGLVTQNLHRLIISRKRSTFAYKYWALIRAIGTAAHNTVAASRALESGGSSQARPARQRSTASANSAGQWRRRGESFGHADFYHATITTLKPP